MNQTILFLNGLRCGSHPSSVFAPSSSNLAHDVDDEPERNEAPNHFREEFSHCGLFQKRPNSQTKMIQSAAFKLSGFQPSLDSRCYACGGDIQGSIVQTGVSVRGAGAPMPEQEPRHMQALTVHDGMGGVAVSQVMKPRIGCNGCLAANPAPELVECLLARRAARQRARKHPCTRARLCQKVQHLPCVDFSFGVSVLEYELPEELRRVLERWAGEFSLTTSPKAFRAKASKRTRSATTTRFSTRIFLWNAFALSSRNCLRCSRP